MDTQTVEILGTQLLIEQLVRAGLEVARPIRDRGIDLITYADLGDEFERFHARPLQLKARPNRDFGINRKYQKFPDLIITYVWNVRSEDDTEVLALTYDEAIDVGDQLGWTETKSWQEGNRYTTTNPSSRVLDALEPYFMSPERWWEKIAESENIMAVDRV